MGKTGTINLTIILETTLPVCTHTYWHSHWHTHTVHHHQWESSPPVFWGPWGFVSARQPTVSTVTVVQMSPAATEMTGRTGGVEERRDRERNIPRLTSTTVGHPWAIKFRAQNWPRWRALIKWIPCLLYFREYTKFVRDWPVAQLTCWSRTQAVYDLLNSNQILSRCFSVERWEALLQAALQISSGANEHSNLKSQTITLTMTDCLSYMNMTMVGGGCGSAGRVVVCKTMNPELLPKAVRMSMNEFSSPPDVCR